MIFNYINFNLFLILMKETNQKDLINKKKRFISSSIYSITEKQEENSESISESKFRKQLVTDNSKNNFIRDAIFDNNLFQFKKYINKKKSSKSFNKTIGDNDYMNNNNFKKFRKKISLLSLHSESDQNESNNTNNNMIQTKSTEHINQKNTVQKRKNLFQLFNKNNLKRKKSVNLYPINIIKKKFNQKLYINNSISSKVGLTKSSIN